MDIERILTVVTPASSYDLTTLAVVKDELGITDTNADATLTRWIAESSERIRAYTERDWGLETVTELFRMNNRETFFGGHPHHVGLHGLRLARWPITEITSLVEDDIYTLVQGVDFEIDANAGLVYRLFNGGMPGGELRWHWRHRKVLVSYSGGYSLPEYSGGHGSAPLRLQQACLALIKGRWGGRTRDPSLRSFIIPGVIEKSYWSPTVGENQMPPDVASVLDSLVDRSF